MNVYLYRKLGSLNVIVLVVLILVSIKDKLTHLYNSLPALYGHYSVYQGLVH